MAVNSEQVNQLKIALEELRANRDVFSRESFAVMVLTLLERLRVAQTLQRDNSQTTDEIRLVTAMFVDVIDSTQISQQLDTSDWKNIINRAHSRLADVVHQWSGEVGQYLGDGLLCFFGAQHSAGDDAIRAVSAALAVRNKMIQFGHEVKRDYGVDFAVRVGLSTGRVVVGIVGSDVKQELLALGPSTTLAARLQALAGVNEICVDAATYSRARAVFDFTPKPPVALKGFEAPIKYYLVKSRRQTRTTEFTTTQINGIEIPFVARTDQIKRLLAFQDIVIAGNRFQAVTLVGDIGLGKSRLLQHLLQQSIDLPFTPIIMVANYERRNSSNNLLRDLLIRQADIPEDAPPEITQKAILDHLMHTWSSPDAVNAAEVMGYLAGFGFDDAPSVQPLRRGDVTREQAGFVWVARWLKAMAERAPLLLIVDNLQWADTSSIDMLNYLAHELSDTAALLVVAARPIYRTIHPTYLRDVRNHTVIELKPFTSAETLDLIAHVLHDVERVPDSVPALINERSEGNPLFVQEFLGMLFDNGVFEAKEEDNRWRFNLILYDSAVSDLPGGLIGVLQARLDDLSADARHVIQLAAISGQTFWTGVLRELTDLEVVPLIEMLVARGMIVKLPESVFEGESQYTFVHTLYRDVAYEMIPRALREKYHRIVANWLVNRIHDKPGYYSLLADQFEQGGQHEAALFVYLEATQNRLQRSQHTEALLLIDRGLAQTRNVSRETALPIASQLWTLRAQALNGLLRYDEAGAASQSALMLLKELPSDTLVHVRVQAARILGMSYRSQGRYQDAFNALNEAYELLPDDDEPQLASVLRSFGSLGLYQGRLGEALAYQQRAYEIAVTTGQTALIASTMTQLGLIAIEQGRIADGLDYFERVLEINQERGYQHFIAEDMRNIALAYWTLGAYERADIVLLTAQEINRAIGVDDSLLLAYRGFMQIMMGYPLEAREMLEAAFTRGHRDIHDARLIQITYVRGLYELGDYITCRERAQMLIDQIGDQNLILRARMQMIMAMASHEIGQHEAIKLFDAALKDEIEYGGRDTWRGHEFMARITPSADRRQVHYQEAARILHELTASLDNHPELKRSFLQNPVIAGIFQITGSPAST